jgi:hypothetical protein
MYHSTHPEHNIGIQQDHYTKSEHEEYADVLNIKSSTRQEDTREPGSAELIKKTVITQDSVLRD